MGKQAKIYPNMFRFKPDLLGIEIESLEETKQEMVNPEIPKDLNDIANIGRKCRCHGEYWQYSYIRHAEQ